MCSILACISLQLVVSCDIQKYDSSDLKDLYKTTIENQFDVDNNINAMFDGYTINIKYSSNVTSVTKKSDMTSNERNLYAIDKVYNKLFKAIFKYFEDWNENFYDVADKRLNGEEFNNLFNKLNSLNNELLVLKDAKNDMEDVLANNLLEDVPSYEITSYVYELNRVVEKSIDFNNYFRLLHDSKVYNHSSDSVITAAAVTRAIDDMVLSLSQMVYIDNIQPFNISNDNVQECDLNILIKSYIDGNEYVILDYLDTINVELSSHTIELIGTGEDIALMKIADKYMYYSKVLRQNILALEQVYDNIDYFRLSMYRYGEINGGIEVYKITVADIEKTSYNFLEIVENFISRTYFTTLEELINY